MTDKENWASGYLNEDKRCNASEILRVSCLSKSKIQKNFAGKTSKTNLCLEGFILIFRMQQFRRTTCSLKLAY